MDKLDKLISETLDDEDRKVLDRIGWEQSPVEMAGDLFRGYQGLVNLSLIVGHLLFLAIGVYATSKAFALTETADVVRWGLIALFFMTGAVIAKVSMLTSLQANRTLRALKRLEMQVALLAAKRSG